MKAKHTSPQEGTGRIAGCLQATGEAPCPIARLLELLSGRWAFPVLYQLLQAQGPIRFSQLQRTVGRVTQKELTKTLRMFEERGLVKRKIYAEVPPRVEYALTRLGGSLGEPLCALARWAEAHSRQIDAACAAGEAHSRQRITAS